MLKSTRAAEYRCCSIRMFQYTDAAVYRRCGIQNLLQSELAQSRMIIWPPTERPAKFSFDLIDRQIIDTGKAQAHQTVLIELPVFVAIRAMPAAGFVMPLIGKLHCDAVELEALSSKTKGS